MFFFVCRFWFKDALVLRERVQITKQRHSMVCKPKARISECKTQIQRQGGVITIKYLDFNVSGQFQLPIWFLCVLCYWFSNTETKREVIGLIMIKSNHSQYGRIFVHCETGEGRGSLFKWFSKAEFSLCDAPGVAGGHPCASLLLNMSSALHNMLHRAQISFLCDMLHFWCLYCTHICHLIEVAIKY